jgi:hypothetical protein
MSDNATPNNVPSDTGQATGQQAVTEAKFTQADLDRIAAKVRAEVKAQYSDYEPLKAELEQRKTAELTTAQRLEQEVERLRQAAAEAERKAAEADLKAIRLGVANSKGLPAELAGLLQGTTQEEIEAHALIVIESAKRIGQKLEPATLDGAAGAGQRGSNNPNAPTEGEVAVARKMGIDPSKLRK